MKTNRALVLGGTGLVGQHLIQLLCNDATWSEVIAITRRKLAIRSDKVTEVLADFSNIDAVSKQFACETVFCCLGSTLKKAGSREKFRQIDHDYIIRCAEIAYQQGAKRFILISSIAADNKASNFYLQVKGETEHDLKAIGFDTVDILQPSLLLAERPDSRFTEEFAGFILPKLSFLMLGPLRQYRPIHVKQVAQAMVAISQTAHSGIHIYTSEKLAAIANQFTG